MYATQLTSDQVTIFYANFDQAELFDVSFHLRAVCSLHFAAASNIVLGPVQTSLRRNPRRLQNKPHSDSQVECDGCISSN
jgi:hypothetical protein